MAASASSLRAADNSTCTACHDDQAAKLAKSAHAAMGCATCHVQAPGERIRAEVLAPALGILNAMPIYRSEWSGMGTTSRRFTTCNSQIRGVPLNPQDDEYRDLEYYLSYVSNGLPISGPGARP